MTQPPGGYPPPPQDPSSGPVPGGYPPPGQQGGYPPQAPGQPSGPAPQYGQQPGGHPAPGQPGGYPPPAQPGGYPPQAQPGGYPPQAPPPAPGQQAGPPPGYAPPPAPGYGQPPNQPGYGQPPAAGYGAPVAGGYPPPGGYPPGNFAQGQAQPAGSPSLDVKSITTAGWGVLGGSLLLLIASFLPFWSISIPDTEFMGQSIPGGGGSLSGWSSWWWIPILLGLAVGVSYLLLLMGVLKPTQVKPEWLVYAAAGVAVLLLFVLLHTFLWAGGYGGMFADAGYSTGPSFGVFLAVVVGLALAYFTALAAQERGARLPITVPGPMKRS